MNLGRDIRGAFRGVFAAALAALVLAAPAAADNVLLQPDGKIVLTGQTWPGFAAMARLNSDGSLDAGFGEGGFLVDRRLPPVTALALQPDGRIVAAGIGGFQLARYLPNGTADPSFAGGGVGGTADPRQVDFVYGDYGPNAIVIRPDGGIVVGGTQEEEVRRWTAPQALVRRYDANGTLLETVGRVPVSPEHPTFESHLGDLLERPDGSLIGIGWTHSADPDDVDGVLLGRFRPGSGTDFDPSFGGGAGLVRLAFPSRGFFSTRAREIAPSGNGWLIAGQTAGTLLLARFDQEGALDSSFGQGGFVAPPITGERGPASDFTPAESWANGLAVAPDGDIVLAGGTSQWGKWDINKMVGPFCVECPQPLLARFDADGRLDPSFGNGGVLRLLRPDGEVFLGSVEDVIALDDGRLLLKGMASGEAPGVRGPFVARLNPDGSYDQSFGEGGWTVLTFPCLERSHAQLRRQSCLPTIDVKLRVKGLRKGRPSLSLRVRPREEWARLRRIVVTLPQMLRPLPGFGKRARVLNVEGASPRGKARARRAKNGHFQRRLIFERLGSSREMRAKLPRGSLEVFGRPPRDRRLEFQLDLELVHDGGSVLAGERELVVVKG